MRSEQVRLLDILEASDVSRSILQEKKAFLQDELIQNWMVNHVSMIGEACRVLPS
jgi:uncharacterized protein with HEPN domain